MKKIISVILLVIMVMPGSMFHSAVIAIILTIIWRQRIKNWLLPKWRYGYKALLSFLVVLAILLMPRPFALPTDRVRFLPLDENYRPCRPSMLQWVGEIIMPEETLCAAGMLIPMSPLRSELPLGESILKDFDYELFNMKLPLFFSPYNSLAMSLESPLSGAVTQVMGHSGTSGRNAYIIRPRHFDPDREYPVVFFAHGYLGNWKLYNGLLKDLDDKIVVSFGTKDLSGIFTHSDIRAIFDRYIPLLEDQGYRVDRREISLIGLSNGGSAVDVAYALFPDRFKNLVYISTGVNRTSRTSAKVLVIGGGRDHCAPSMRRAMKVLKSRGQRSSFLFDEKSTHFMLVTDRPRVISFLKEEL